MCAHSCARQFHTCWSVWLFVRAPSIEIVSVLCFGSVNLPLWLHRCPTPSCISPPPFFATAARFHPDLLCRVPFFCFSCPFNSIWVDLSLLTVPLPFASLCADQAPFFGCRNVQLPHAERGVLVLELLSPWAVTIVAGGLPVCSLGSRRGICGIGEHRWTWISTSKYTRRDPCNAHLTPAEQRQQRQCCALSLHGTWAHVPCAVLWRRVFVCDTYPPPPLV